MEWKIYERQYFPCSRSLNMVPFSKAITRFLSLFTIWSSCVAMMMVFHSFHSSRRRCIISSAFFLSRFPVGSSPIIIDGLWMSALAIQVLCISQPERVSMNFSFFSKRPTWASTSGTLLVISRLLYQQTSIAKATFSRTVFLWRSLKSWNMTPISRLYCSRSQGENVAIFFQSSLSISHDFGLTIPSSDRIKVVFQLHEAQIRKTNSQGSIESEIFRKMLLSLYAIVTELYLIVIFVKH